MHDSSNSMVLITSDIIKQYAQRGGEPPLSLPLGYAPALIVRCAAFNFDLAILPFIAGYFDGVTRPHDESTDDNYCSLKLNHVLLSSYNVDISIYTYILMEVCLISLT